MTIIMGLKLVGELVAKWEAGADKAEHFCGCLDRKGFLGLGS